MLNPLQDNYYCTHCSASSSEEQECCGTKMIEYTDAEGFGLTDFEPAGSNSCDFEDNWN